MGRKKNIKPKIEPEEIERLRALIAKEEELELEMHQDLKEAIKASDKKLLRELHRLENKNRRLIMWIGVVVLMLVIVGFWISKVDSVITRPLTNTDKTQDFDLTKTGANMQEMVSEVLKNIEEIKNQAKQLEEAGGQATTSRTFKGETKLP